MGLLRQFDAYNRGARIFPALVAGWPTLALLLVLVPWDYLGLPHLTASVMGVVLLFAFADLARRAGRQVEAKLGTRATPEQWHRGNPDIPETAKDRYRKFIERKLGRSAPTAEEESGNPAQANDFYLSAGNWLREHTRNTRKFTILFGENITYGYRRNLLGLKPIALCINTVVVGFCAAVLWWRLPYFVDIPHIQEKMVIIIAAAFLHTAYMLFAVGREGVRDASRMYGRQLILSCENLLDKAPAAKTSKSKGTKATAERNT